MLHRVLIALAIVVMLLPTSLATAPASVEAAYAGADDTCEQETRLTADCRLETAGVLSVTCPATGGGCDVTASGTMTAVDDVPYRELRTSVRFGEAFTIATVTGGCNMVAIGAGSCEFDVGMQYPLPPDGCMHVEVRTTYGTFIDERARISHPFEVCREAGGAVTVTPS